MRLVVALFASSIFSLDCGRIVVYHITDGVLNDADSHHPRATFSSTALCAYTPEKACRERGDFFCVSVMLNHEPPWRFFF